MFKNFVRLHLSDVRHPTSYETRQCHIRSQHPSICLLFIVHIAKQTWPNIYDPFLRLTKPFSHFFENATLQLSRQHPQWVNFIQNFVCCPSFQSVLMTACLCVFVSLHLSLRERVLAWITPRSHRAKFLRWLTCLWPYTSMATAPSAKNSTKSSDTGTDNSCKVIQIRQEFCLLQTIILHFCLSLPILLFITNFGDE